MAFDQSVGGMVSLVVSLQVFTILTLVLRFIVRKKQKMALGLDDWCVLPAWICFVGMTAIACYGMKNRFVAFPVWNKKSFLTWVVPVFVRVYWASNLLGIVALACIRLSALFFYRRIFITHNKRDAFGIISACAIAIICLWTVAFIFFQIFNCGLRFGRLFDPQAQDTLCASCPFLQGLAISSFLLDLLIVILPIPKIWTLHTTTSRKIGISAAFLLAAAGVGASGARMAMVVKSITADNNDDVFLLNTRIFYYTILEVGFCLIAVNLPSIWYLFRDITLDKILHSVRSLASLRSYSFSGNSSKHSEVESTTSSDHEITATHEYTIDFEAKQGKSMGNAR